MVLKHPISLPLPVGLKIYPPAQISVLNPDIIRTQFPFINDHAIAMLHTRRCGWLSAQQLGAFLLKTAKEKGLKYLNGRVSAVETSGQRIKGITIDHNNRTTHIQTRAFVNAAGPFLTEIGEMIGIELPVVNRAPWESRAS